MTCVRFSLAAGSKPGFNVDEARVQTLDGHKCVIRQYTQIQLGVVCMLMNVQTITHDDFRQFGSVEYIQQRTYYRTLGHSTQDCMPDGQA